MQNQYAIQPLYFFYILNTCIDQSGLG
ncbi:uncharacterized protein METZ01_LOCUS120395, partial [marine metagenome]